MKWRSRSVKRAMVAFGVTSRPHAVTQAMSALPRKRTNSRHFDMSALCQKRTYAPQQIAIPSPRRPAACDTMIGSGPTLTHRKHQSGFCPAVSCIEGFCNASEARCLTSTMLMASQKPHRSAKWRRANTDVRAQVVLGEWDGGSCEIRSPWANATPQPRPASSERAISSRKPGAISTPFAI
jgi:hypothetical protein